MPLSIAEHVDILWIVTTSLFGLGLMVTAYFLKSWKVEVDEALERLGMDSKDEAIELVKLYVNKEEQQLSISQDSNKKLSESIVLFEERMAKADRAHNEMLKELYILHGFHEINNKPHK